MIEILGQNGVVGSFSLSLFFQHPVRDQGMVASGRVELYTMYT